MSLEKLRNIHKGKRCFILGSGPSINDEDLTILKNEFTFCSNWFINHEQIKELGIDYYCAYDDAFVSDGVNDIWKEKLNSLGMQCFFPTKWKKFNIVKDVHYINYNDKIKVYKEKKFSSDITKEVYDGATVIINMCLPIAIYMGFSEIILLGVDNSYYKDGKLNPYFYNTKEHKTDFDNSFERNLQWQKNTALSYEVVQNKISNKETIIYNGSKKSNLTYFEFIKIEDVVDNFV